MNPNNQIIEFFENNGIIEFTENIEVIENIVFVENPENPENLENIPINEQVVFDLGPMPVLRRHNPPVYFGEEEGDLLEGELQEYMVPDDFVKPAHCPRLYCSKCYWAQCSGTCAIDTPFIQAIRAEELAFEEEMDLPPPPRLTRNINTPLLDSEWALLPSIPPPLTRCYTNAHLLDNELDEDDDSDEFDMPEGVEYVCLSINKDEDKEQDK